MAAAHVTRPAAAVAANGSRETDRLGGSTLAKARLEAWTDTLDYMANWRNDLGARLWRAQVRFELVGLDAEEQDRLAAEIHAFHSVCFALAEHIRGAPAMKADVDFGRASGVRAIEPGRRPA